MLNTGELLENVWFLIAHLGITNRFHISRRISEDGVHSLAPPFLADELSELDLALEEVQSQN